MATVLLAEGYGNQVDGSPAPTLLTVTYGMSLPLLMHPWETRWGNCPLHFFEQPGL